MNALSQEETAALEAYAAKHGRAWKSNLRAEWERSAAGNVLQGLRNASYFGPSGLIAFRINK